MRKFGRTLGRILLLLVLLGAGLYLWKRDEVHRLLAVNSLFSEDKIVGNFSTMNAMFLSVPLSRGDGPVAELPKGAPITLPDGYDAWTKDRAVTAIVVLRDGKIRHESYYKGTGAEDLRISWSVAKSFLSALMGIIVAEGKIESLDDTVEKYAPELKGGAYEGATIRNVLNMASGVKFNEDYFDFWSDINRMGRVLAFGSSMDGFAAGLTETRAKPGDEWHYVSIDTHVLSMVIRGATGRRIKDLMSEKILSKLGLEADGYYVTDGYETAFVLGGINLRTRDYARFGMMFANGGRVGDTQVVPGDWVAQSTTRSAPGGAGYGFQWWLEEDAAPGEYFGRGVYGQYIYIDTARSVVIAANGADRAFKADGAHRSMIEMFRALARASD